MHAAYACSLCMQPMHAAYACSLRMQPTHAAYAPVREEHVRLFVEREGNSQVLDSTLIVLTFEVIDSYLLRDGLG